MTGSVIFFACCANLHLRHQFTRPVAIISKHDAEARRSRGIYASIIDANNERRYRRNKFRASLRILIHSPNLFSKRRVNAPPSLPARYATTLKLSLSFLLALRVKEGEEPQPPPVMKLLPGAGWTGQAGRCACRDRQRDREAGHFGMVHIV